MLINNFFKVKIQKNRKRKQERQWMRGDIHILEVGKWTGKRVLT